MITKTRICDVWCITPEVATKYGCIKAWIDMVNAMADKYNTGPPPPNFLLQRKMFAIKLW